MTRKPAGTDDLWTRRHYEVEIAVESDEEVETAREQAERLIDAWLQAEEASVLEFDPEELMRHEWKGKKAEDGYNKGSLSWGWDFSNHFSPSVIEVLKKGPIRIDRYEFSLSRNERIVQTRKVREK